MYTVSMAPLPLLSVKGEEVVVGLPLPAPEQCHRTHSSTCACADDTLMRGRELVLHCFRCSCTPAAREEFSATLHSEAFRSCSHFSAHQFFLEDGRVKADASVTALECERLG